MNESNRPPFPPEASNPEDAFLDPDNIPADVLARLEAADSASELARKPGLSTLTTLAQQSLLEQMLNRGNDPIVQALEEQTKREISEGVFDLASLRPELRNLLSPKQEDLPVDQGDL